MSLYRWPLALLLLSALAGCGWSGGMIEGTVLEEGTQRPISNAVVIARWSGHTFGIVDSQSACIHADSTVTDSQGRYRLASWSKSSTISLLSHIEPSVTAYKAGYGYPTRFSQTSGIEYLAPFKGSREEHFSFLISMATSNTCHEAGDSQQKLYPLYEALYYEAKALAATADERKKLEWFREVAASKIVGGSDGNSWEEHKARINEFLQGHLQ